MMKNNLVFRFAVLSLFLISGITCFSQQITMQSLKKAFESDTTITLEKFKIEIESYDYLYDSTNVQSLIFKPITKDKSPGLLLIPGYSRTAVDYIPIALQFAKGGIACIVITQMGFGASEGKSDFVGPETLARLEFGLNKFRNEPFVDSSKVGVYGYSRGAMAASLLACKLDCFKAVVLGAGIYDLEKAFYEIKIDGILENIIQQADTTEQSFYIRSSIFLMDSLNAPVLILHGDNDKNAPVSQAYLLEAKLKELNKPYQIKIFQGLEHNLGMANIKLHAVEFIKNILL